MIPVNVPPAYTALCAKTAQLRTQCWESVPNTHGELVARFMKAHEDELAAETQNFDLGEFVQTTRKVEDGRVVILPGTVFSIVRDTFGKVAEFRDGKKPITHKLGQKYLFRELEKSCRLLDVPKEEPSVQRIVLQIRLDLAGFQPEDTQLGTVLLGLVDAGRLDAALLPKLAADLYSATNPLRLLASVAAQKETP